MPGPSRSQGKDSEEQENLGSREGMRVRAVTGADGGEPRGHVKMKPFVPSERKATRAL